MSWIDTVSYADADSTLRKLYDRVKGPDDNVDNIMLAHSLRPHTMTGHMALYKNVLHHQSNTVPKWLLEAIGVYTSQLNRCAYCVEHHSAGLERLVNDADRYEQLSKALSSRRLADAFSPAQAAALEYAARLTLEAVALSASDINQLREHGWDDGQILEFNQVTAYFNYANRTVLGLGINIEGDELGLSPGDCSDPNNWQHR